MRIRRPNLLCQPLTRQRKDSSGSRAVRLAASLKYPPTKCLVCVCPVCCARRGLGALGMGVSLSREDPLLVRTHAHVAVVPPAVCVYVCFLSEEMRDVKQAGGLWGWTTPKGRSVLGN